MSRIRNAASIAAAIGLGCLSSVGVGLVLGPTRANAQEQRETLRVGHPVAFTPGALPARVTCDNLSVLRVQDARTYFRLTGLKPGSTLCSFGSVRTPGRPQLFQFNVIP